jgi:hypothetical protein
VAGVGVFSPPVDEKGNSVRGVRAARSFPIGLAPVHSLALRDLMVGIATL